MQRLLPKRSWRKRSTTDIGGELPISNPASAAGRRESQSWSARSVPGYNRVHLIPVVVMLCFFILWIFSSPVDLETKNGRTVFVPRAKTKSPPQDTEATDVDLTMLAIESPPDDFVSLSNGPFPSLAVRYHPDVPLLESQDHNPPLTDSHEPHPSSSLSHELKPPLSVSLEPITSFSDSHEPNKLLSDSYEPNAFTVFHEVISYPGISNEDAP